MSLQPIIDLDFLAFGSGRDQWLSRDETRLKVRVDYRRVKWMDRLGKKQTVQLAFSFLHLIVHFHPTPYFMLLYGIIYTIGVNQKSFELIKHLSHVCIFGLLYFKKNSLISEGLTFSKSQFPKSIVQ